MRYAILVLAFAASAAAADPTGAGWRGGWSSDSSGHSGPMRASIAEVPGGYRILFAGRFAKVVPFAYRATLHEVGRSGDAVYLTAERHLPIFGTFRTDAVLTPQTLEATYDSRVDRGRFLLKR